MENISDRYKLVTQRPIAVIMTALAVIVFGYVSFSKLSLNLMPDISYPTLTVRTEFEGAAPEEVESLISRPIEQVLAVVRNKTAISSISRAGQSDVILEFTWDTDMNSATQDTRELLEQFQPPEDAEKPMVLRYDPTLDPIIRFGIYAEEKKTDNDLYVIRELAEEEIKRDLEAISGVAAVKVKGGLEEEIVVALNEKELTSLGLDINEINRRLAAENVNLAGGNLEEGDTEYMVRTLNLFLSIDEINNLIIARREGADIRLRDIGRVYKSHKEREVITRVNGRESVEIEIYKEADANIVQLAQRVKTRVFGTPGQQAAFQRYLKSLETSDKEKDEAANNKGPKAKRPDYIIASLPDGINMALLSDQSTFIENSINEVKNTAILGGIFAVLVLFLFLRSGYSTFIIALSIPLSIIATFAPMNIFNVTLNMMSLGGLALGIGMLVDNSIVVLESIFRCREEGDSIVESAIRGASEVGGAVTASTLTTISVFLPIVFVEGVAGQLFGDLSLTVVFSLFMSLIAALFFIPMLASRDFSKYKGPEGAIQKSFLSETWTGIKQSFKDFAGSGRRLLRKIWNFYITKKRFVLLRPLMALLGIFIFAFTFMFLIFCLLLLFLGQLFSKIIILFIYLVFAVAGLLISVLSKLISRYILKPILYLFEKWFEAVKAAYPRIIGNALENKTGVVVFSVVLMIIVFGLITPQLGMELIPEIHQGEFNVELRMPVGTPVEATDEAIAPMDRFISSLTEIGMRATVVGAEKSSSTSSEEGEHTAKITVRLKENGNLIQREETLIEMIRDKSKEIPQVETKISRPTLFSFKTPIEVEVKGYNLDLLKDISNKVATRMENIEGIFDVKNSFQQGNPEIQVIYDRELIAKYGLDIAVVAQTVRNKVLGDIPTKFNKEDRKIEIRVLVKKTDRNTLEELRQLNIAPNAAVPIPLSAVAELKLEEGPAEIRRIEQQRAALITANVSGLDLGSAAANILKSLDDIQIPSDFSIDISGQNKEMEVSMNSLTMAMLLAIFLVYTVMAMLFESIIQPLIIILSIPLALVGVILVLWIGGIPISVVVGIGVIVLVGIVVNNAIVLIDYTNTLRKRGMALNKAVIEAGTIRLRPILMTTTTTVLGLLPMALGLGEGAEIRTPMAWTIISGLLVSTILTLVVIPTVYAYVSELLDNKKNKKS